MTKTTQARTLTEGALSLLRRIRFAKHGATWSKGWPLIAGRLDGSQSRSAWALEARGLVRLADLTEVCRDGRRHTYSVWYVTPAGARALETR